MENRFIETEKFRYYILAIQRLGNRIYKDILSEIGVTPSHAEVIHILMMYQPISLKELGSLLICESGSPSRLIERMVKENLVERGRDKSDSRFVQLQLTSIGTDKYHLIVQAETELNKILEEIYTKDELQLTNELLSKFLTISPLASTLIKRGYIQDSETIHK